MCGIFGASIQSVEPKHIQFIENILLETEIRGKHASGISWFDGSSIKTEKRPVPISEFLSDFDLTQCVVNGSINMIGHIRYSTSDLKYNQPISDDSFALAHNGVISQKDSSFWEEEYGVRCETKNDSELLFHCIKQGDDPEVKFNHPSISFVSLDAAFFRKWEQRLAFMKDIRKTLNSPISKLCLWKAISTTVLLQVHLIT